MSIALLLRIYIDSLRDPLVDSWAAPSIGSRIHSLTPCRGPWMARLYVCRVIYLHSWGDSLTNSSGSVAHGGKIRHVAEKGGRAKWIR